MKKRGIGILYEQIVTVQYKTFVQNIRKRITTSNFFFLAIIFPETAAVDFSCLSQ